jgi:hypothetical protein
VKSKSKLVVILSSTPSKTIDPPLATLNVGPLVKVPLYPLPLLSVQTVPLPG